MHQHEFERFVLIMNHYGDESFSTKVFSKTLTPENNVNVSYVGYQCVKCGEVGYAA